ncbi:MAG: RluA family pseudouridine synthase [Clostridia bacterium]|nr:RluA family pseudouridine synthase [Clostridia bacterium]
MSLMLEYKATQKDEGKTVERILKREFGISSKLMIYLKMNKKLFLSGEVCRSVDVCKTNDIISADVAENNDCTEEILPWKEKLDILYEDNFLLVVNKPGNMEVHPCLGNRNTTLANAVMYHWKANGEYHNYHIVNRLDKDTSGICVIAKNRFAHGVLSAQLKAKIFKRGYTAIVHGKLQEEHGSIELPIKRDAEGIIKRTVAEDGKYAKTNYNVLISGQNFSVVDINLETGRTHQIRVHFSHIGHPLVGDWLYGNGDNERCFIDRQALHAGYAEFLHPASKKNMIFKTSVPREMECLINLVEKE